jgi:hypothetical protein
MAILVSASHQLSVRVYGNSVACISPPPMYTLPHSPDDSRRGFRNKSPCSRSSSWQYCVCVRLVDRLQRSPSIPGHLQYIPSKISSHVKFTLLVVAHRSQHRLVAMPSSTQQQSLPRGCRVPCPMHSQRRKKMGANSVVLKHGNSAQTWRQTRETTPRSRPQSNFDNMAFIQRGLPLSGVISRKAKEAACRTIEACLAALMRCGQARHPSWFSSQLTECI